MNTATATTAPCPPPPDPSETYLIDAVTWRLLELNDAARSNVQYDAAQLAAMTPLDLAPELAAADFAALLASLGHAAGDQRSLLTRHRRADGTLYPVRLSFVRAERDGRALLLAIGDDQSAAQAACAALAHYQTRFNAIVSNTPGLVYQFVLGAGGAIGFPYLSGGCAALLGLSSAALQAAPHLFLRLILPEDRRSYEHAMRASAVALSSWNWEGRIWIDAWKDVKWINLRSSPRALDSDGSVQWEGIMTNITASKLEQLEVSNSRAALAELTAHIEEVKEQERTRIAREIHDDLGGNLTAIKMALAMLARRLPAEEPQLAEKAAYVDALVDRTIDAVHRISLDLRPSMLDFGIVAALEWQLREFEKQMGLRCSFTSNQKEIDLSAGPATALFRIFQEALNNIAKHANATRVAVTLQRLPHHIALKITDNGGGIDPLDRVKPGSFGLRGMSERARALGGTLALSRPPGGGTMVTIQIKLIAHSTHLPHSPQSPHSLRQDPLHP
ncbi:MAG: sensor histidine kinase [Massilia sp.]|nr:sensor histidine kinase [Massilia sp.]